MQQPEYKLDRTAFQKLTIEEADKQMQQSAGISLQERCNQFNYLMSIAYRFFGESWPVIDRTAFEMRKRN